MSLSRPAAGIAAALLASLALVACSSSDDAGTEPTGAASDEAATDEAATDDATTESTDEAASDATFPITIEHAFGETVIESAPERVVSVDWANHEAALALGVVPVAMQAAWRGDDDADGVLPWVEDRLTELGADTPILLDEAEGYDYEAIADAQPDVIIAAYSGMTAEQYETLSKIAPVVAYPEVAWGTTWQQMTITVGTALGKQGEAEELVAELEAHVADLVAQQPSLSGQPAIFSYFDPTNLSTLGFYTTHDPRAAFLNEIGLSTAAVVEEASAASGEFWKTYTTEEIERFEDLATIVIYGNDETLGIMQADPLLNRIPAVADGAVALLTDDTPVAAAANPSPLSITSEFMSEYVALVGAAAANAS